MQAVILAAGKGMRMRPLTDNVPKALLKLDEQTILDHTISELPDSIDEIIIVVGYLQEQIRKHIAEHYSDRKIIFVESEAKGTGYALSMCKSHLHGDFLVLNGDDLYDKSDLERLVVERWTFLVKEMQGMERVGAIQTDAEGNFTGITPGEKGKPGLFNIGAYVLGEDYFTAPLVKFGAGEYGLPHTLLGMVKQGYKIKVIKAQYWEPIGFPEDLEKLRQRLNV